MKRLALALALAVAGTAGVLAPQTADAQYYTSRYYDDYGYRSELYRRHEVIWMAGRPYHRFTREPLVRVNTRYGVRYAPIGGGYAYRGYDRRYGPSVTFSFSRHRYDRPYYRNRYYYDRW